MKRLVLHPAAALFLLLLLFLAPSALWAASPGKGAPVEFTGTTIDGKPLSSRQLLGRPYIVNFFASWCPYCRREVPDVVALQEKYAGKEGFTVLGIAFKDKKESMEDFIWEMGINYPVIMGDDAIMAAFAPHDPQGLKLVPTAFVVGRDGRVLNVVTGVQSEAALEELAEQAFDAKP